MKMPIIKAMHAASTHRWHLVDTLKPNNVADHSFNVALLAMEIFNRLGLSKEECGFTERDVCYFAMIHDIREVLTCDIPSPVKQAMKDKGFDPECLFGEYQHEERPILLMEHIIYLADKIENCLFISEYGVGSRARLAQEDALVSMAAAFGKINGKLGDIASAIYREIREEKNLK